MSSVISVINAGIVNKLATSSYRPTVSFEGVKDLLASSVKFPRIELDINKARGVGYVCQRTIQWSVRYRIVGYLKKTSIADGQMESNWTEQDQVNIINFGMNTASLIYSMTDERNKYPGFLQFGGFPEIWTDLEIIPKISAFAFNLEVIIDKLDTTD